MTKAKSRGQDARTRRIERRLRALLLRLYPDISGDDAMAVLDRCRPLILQAARDGLGDPETLAGRAQGAALLPELRTALTAALAAHDAGSMPVSNAG